MKTTAASYYANMTAGILVMHIAAWKSEIANAEANRLAHPAKMDIIGAREAPEAKQSAGPELLEETGLDEALTLALSIEQKQ